MLRKHSAKETSQRPASRFLPIRKAPIYASPSPLFSLVSTNNCKGGAAGLFCLLSTENSGYRRRVRMEFTKLIYLVRWSRQGGQQKDVYFFCDDSKKERGVARQTA